MSEYCKITKDNGFLVVSMPDGQVIPGQQKLKITQDINIDGRKIVEIEFTAVIHMSVEDFKTIDC